MTNMRYQGSLYERMKTNMKVEFLTENEKLKFEEIIQKLLRYNHLNKYLSNKKAKRVLNSDYQFVKTNFEMFHDFLNYAGFQLYIVDAQDERSIIYIEGELESSKYKLSKLESACLFVFRFLYEEDKMNLSMGNGIFVSMKDLYTNLVGVFGIYNSDPIRGEMLNALNNLANMNVINVIKTQDDDYAIEVFPYICYVLTSEKIKRILDELREGQSKDEVK